MKSDVVNPESPLEMFLWAVGDGGQIGKCDDFIDILMNGRECYYVQVILKDKSQRTIKAYGQDAIDLYKNVMKMKKAQGIRS